jgi:hypothetical protein
MVERRNHKRRTEDKRRHAILRENWYRDVWLVIITVIVFLALIAANGERQRNIEGRRIAVESICGATSAVITAGRAVIGGSGAGLAPELERFLRKHGYPPKPVRQAEAKKAAEAYAESIARGIESNSGVTGLVRKNGTLNCRKMVRKVTQQ